MPIEPAATSWVLPDLRTRRLDVQLDDMVAIGADLAPGTLLAAYRLGLFPMPGDEPGEILWFSPVLRGVLPLDGLRVTSSLRKTMKRFEIRVDTAFRAVMEDSGAYSWIELEKDRSSG